MSTPANGYNSDLLRPGMTMGYSPASMWKWEGGLFKTIGELPGKLLGRVITAKTWMNLTHVETYIGDNTSVAARWDGVQRYPVREDECLCILLEPAEPFNIEKAMTWFFSHAEGMKYDLWGMRIFYRCISRTNPRRMWCSEFVTEFYRAGGFDPFNPLLAADRVSPAQFLQTGKFRVVWHNQMAYKARWVSLANKSVKIA